MATRSSSAKRNAAADPALPQKKRARRRLIGATALCLLAALVLPTVFDSEPRRSRDDIQVRIPSRDTPITDAGPLAQPSVAQGGEADASPDLNRTDPKDAAQRGESALRNKEAASVPNAAAPRAEQGTDPRTETPEPPKAAQQEAGARGGEAKGDSRTGPRSDSRVEARADKRTDQKTEGKADGKAEARSEPRFDPKTDPIAKLAEARAGTAPAKPGAYLLQTGAYASEGAASEQLERLRKAGVNAYTETVKTRQGERIRVRAGPFPNREAAEQARTKLKSAGIEAALIAPVEGR